MSNLAHPQTFFAARRNLRFVNGRYQPSIPVKDNAGLTAQATGSPDSQQHQPTTTRENEQPTQPDDQVTASETTKDDSSRCLVIASRLLDPASCCTFRDWFLEASFYLHRTCLTLLTSPNSPHPKPIFLCNNRRRQAIVRLSSDRLASCSTSSPP